MPIPHIKPMGVIAGISAPNVINLHISGIKLNCLTCGDGGLVVATHASAGWLISCRNGHDYEHKYEPVAGLMIIISPEDDDD